VRPAALEVAFTVGVESSARVFPSSMRVSEKKITRNAYACANNGRPLSCDWYRYIALILQRGNGDVNCCSSRYKETLIQTVL